MKNVAIKSTLTAVAVTLSLGVVMTAKAELVDETVVSTHATGSKSVTYSRAELTTEQGRQSLEARIRRAAEDVCGPVGYREAGSLALSARNKECADQAVAQAMSQMGADQIASTAR